MLKQLKKLKRRPGRADIALLVMTMALMIPSFAFADNKVNLPFLDGLKGAFFGVLQIIVVAIVGWVSVGMLKNKQYGQFIGFLVFAVLIYVIVFNPDIFTKIGGQVGTEVKNVTGGP